MKLYYMPGTCALASHIILQEVGRPYDLDRVDTATRLTESGERYDRVNPKGVVPALTTDTGETLTEGAAILQYVADSAGATDLAPPTGTMARARVTEVLNFVASELHVSFGPLFSPTADEAAKDAARTRAAVRFDWLEGLLRDGRAYLTGQTFTVADAYAFAVTRWTEFTGIDIARWPRLVAFMARVQARPAVEAAMKSEGLI
jgi:glutathione S-transferase